MLVATKKVSALTPTKTVSVDIIVSEPEHVSLNYSFNFLKGVLNITRFQFDNISPILSQMSIITSTSLLTNLNGFGSKEQKDISNSSTLITELNKCITFNENKSIISKQLEKETKLFYTGEKTNKLDLLKQFNSKCIESITLNTATKNSLIDLKTSLKKDVEDVMLYIDILKLILNDLTSIMTSDNINNTPIPSRVISLTSSITVGTQLLSTVDILISNLENEESLYDDFCNNLYPSYITLWSNNEIEFNKHVTKLFLS